MTAADLTRAEYRRLSGVLVRSLYRTRWTGVVVGFSGDSCLQVKMVRDRHDRPIRRGLQRTVIRHARFFELHTGL